ncbi:hypothetical protein BS47DRAFT_1365943 [Hydnum rufescens UP504]|uniref:DUF6532 domain-containing protein n=1 Tax=Hydnum rufescens UP504 TaxID=1448309 RepID=A0A9P6AMF0_9AGAM|nr:hypothetical protein BS47DRAFT_1365943 [Hydnum rufescens UP504]
MASGIQQQTARTGCKVGKPVDINNSAPQLFLLLSEAAKKAMKTQKENKECQQQEDAITGALISTAAPSEPPNVAMGGATPMPDQYADESRLSGKEDDYTLHQSDIYAAEDARIMAERAKEDEAHQHLHQKTIGFHAWLKDDEESLSVQSSFEQPPNVPMPPSATAFSGGILAKRTSDVFKSDHGNSSPEPKKSRVLSDTIIISKPTQTVSLARLPKQCYVPLSSPSETCFSSPSRSIPETKYAPRPSKLSHSRHLSMTSGDGNMDSDMEVLSKPMTGKRTSRIIMKDLKLSNPLPEFSANLATAVHDFHMFILMQNMFPNDVKAHYCIQETVDSINGTSENHDLFSPDEGFYKAIINEAASFHSKFKQKALNTVPYLYGFFRKDQDAIIHVVGAALQYQCYRYEYFEGHPEKPRKNALRHPAISTIINTFFELLEVASDVMPTFLEMPCETIAFTLTVSLQIHNVLASWKQGGVRNQILELRSNYELKT